MFYNPYLEVLLFLSAIILAVIAYKLYNSYINKNEIKEPFLFIQDSNLYIGPDKKENAVEIKYQLPLPANDLTDIQQQDIDSDLLRNTRSLRNFSLTDELDFYQMYNLLKKIRNQEYEITFDPDTITKKSHIIANQKLISLNSGAINNTNLELFTRIKLELVSAFNKVVIATGYFTPYHPYQFFKIINSNLISENTKSEMATGISADVKNYVFTLTFAREYKYQQFVIYYDIDLIPSSDKKFKLKINKVELIGIPIPKTIEFHENSKTSDKPDLSTFKINPNDFLNQEQLQQNDLLNLVESESLKAIEKKEKASDYYYKDQVSDSAKFDVQPSGDKSIAYQSPNMKFIDRTERSDIDLTLLDENSVAAKVEEKRMNIARDQQFNNHRCFGLVNGISQELPQYKNPIFCKSYHPDINQNGIWDAPCQVNTDCPFFQANKNYPNEFGKCNKETGKCEMPLGVIPIGFTKYGKIEPNCYNCGNNVMDNKCCGKQADDIKSGKVLYKSPDYIFADDNSQRLAFSEQLKEIGLDANPSI
jgi:hypothetical protein